MIPKGKKRWEIFWKKVPSLVVVVRRLIANVFFTPSLTGEKWKHGILIRQHLSFWMKQTNLSIHFSISAWKQCSTFNTEDSPQIFFKRSLHCMEINTEEPPGWRPVRSEVQCTFHLLQDGLFQVLQINIRFCFNCWSVVNALARLSTLTSASRAAHLTWVEDRLSAHRAHNCSRRGRNHLYRTTSLPLTHNSLIILLSTSSLFNKEEVLQMDTPI